MKKSILSIAMTAAIPLAALSLAACGGSQTASTADYIGIDAAKEAALSDAGVSADGAEFSTAGLDSRNGVFYYAVDFTENGVNYEYDIDALTGVVIERAKTPAAGGQGEAGTETAPGTPAAASGTAAPAGETAAQVPASTSPAGSQETGSGGPITEAEARAIALSQAGLTEADVRFIESKKDRHDGQSVFEVEFDALTGEEYSYDIREADGAIVSYDYDSDRNPSVNSSGSGMLSEDQIRETVLSRVPGASAADVRLWLDEDDDRYQYEGQLIWDGMEYEFKIDAYSGSVLEWEADTVR
ncbi:MAG TPA: PepSY domain-containing protein [Candidatus Lachnoclostridium stercoripullorum]|uniref:PepSY domain-containing protein n=1 Tax=Candidatus Lachnoclostridium stercoripullorum TaxID=2838635 RepID=A0A9D1W4M7_9FIRM|nr:PepSY domain-containing protein [Candidatus Lachnoclostridium stercoripullorum]